MFQAGPLIGIHILINHSFIESTYGTSLKVAAFALWFTSPIVKSFESTLFIQGAHSLVVFTDCFIRFCRK